MRKCGTCLIEKNESFFNKKGKGLQSICKECNKINLKLHYSQNKTYYKTKSKRIQKQAKDVVKQIKENAPCTDCKKYYPFYVMDFDHTNIKKFTIATSFTRKGLNQILEEINQCDLVCANCHRIRTYQRKTLMPSSVIGNTTDFESVESTFEP